MQAIERDPEATFQARGRAENLEDRRGGFTSAVSAARAPPTTGQSSNNGGEPQLRDAANGDTSVHASVQPRLIGFAS
jgi:hypothetical protein